MLKDNSLEILKQSFEGILPSKDNRSNISPLEFIVTLVFCYLGDSKTFLFNPFAYCLQIST